MPRWPDPRLFLRLALTTTSLVGSMCFLGSCSGTQLGLRDTRLTPRQLIDESSLIVVGTIAKIEIVGPVRTSGTLRFKTWKVDVDPGLVIQGELNTNGHFSYLLNNYAPEMVQNGDFDWIKKGELRIFFLRTEGGVLRATADVHKATLPLARPTATLPNNNELTAKKISRLLLTPGSGANGASFVASLSQATSNSLRVAGYAFTASLLKPLLINGDPSVRKEACLAFYEQLFGVEGCLLKLESAVDIVQMIDRIRAARQRRDHVRRLCAVALAEKRDSPLASAYTYSGDQDDPQNLNEMFEYLTQNGDEVLRASAEKQLERLSGKQ